MKRRDEFLVGLVLLGAVAAVVLGAIFLSDSDISRREELRTARFRSIGRIQPGSPVILRGVKIGTVATLRLADNGWVEVDLRVARAVQLPDDPAVVAVPASLFGEWQALVVSRSEVSDPNLRAALAEAAVGAGSTMPGSDLPDIGELTAQASRIAADVGLITERVEGAIDSTVIAELRRSVTELSAMAGRLNEFARSETSTLGRITRNADRLAISATEATDRIQATMGRVEEATRDGRVERIAGAAERATSNVDSITADFRAVARTARDNRETLVRVLATLDSVLTRLEGGRGTLGMLVSDSALYRETLSAVSEFRALLTDIRRDPRRYFRFSVF